MLRATGVGIGREESPRVPGPDIHMTLGQKRAYLIGMVALQNGHGFSRRLRYCQLQRVNIGLFRPERSKSRFDQLIGRQNLGLAGQLQVYSYYEAGNLACRKL